MFVNVNGRFIKTNNSRVFNKEQETLLALINSRIQKEFKTLKDDKDSKECLSDIDSIPQYQMNDLKISFYNEEIWFEVNWGLSGACRAVDGTIVSFKLKEISKYLN